MSLTLPNLTKFINNFKDVRQQDQAYGLKLKQVVAAIDQQNPTYYNVPEG